MAVFSRWVVTAGCLVHLPAPLAAQEAADTQPERPVSAEEALYNADEMWKLNPGEEDEDPCEQPDDPDVILVCRETVDPERYMFEREPELTVGADVRTTASGAPRPPDFNDSCLNTRGRANCNMGGYVPPPAIMVDFDELPETPEGSDAARLYGGPTAADEVEDAIISARRPDIETRTARQDEDSEVERDVGLETQLGIEDEIYGP